MNEGGPAPAEVVAARRTGAVGAQPRMKHGRRLTTRSVIPGHLLAYPDEKIGANHVDQYRQSVQGHAYHCDTVIPTALRLQNRILPWLTGADGVDHFDHRCIKFSSTNGQRNRVLPGVSCPGDARVTGDRSSQGDTTEGGRAHTRPRPRTVTCVRAPWRLVQRIQNTPNCVFQPLR